MPAYALLVDSDPTHLAVYAALLKAQRLPAVTARDGEAALTEVAKRGTPRLLITELSLPRVDGFSLLEKLGALGRSPPTLAISNVLALRNAAFARRVELGITAVLAHAMPVASIERAVQIALQPSLPAPLLAPPPPEPSRAADPARLAAVQATGLAASDALDPALQALCAEVARAFKVETALISFIEKERQWFKAFAGLRDRLLAERSVPLSQSLCRHTVDANGPLVVPDARLNPAFANNPLVEGGGLRGYASVPLQTAGGTVLGTLCVLDSKPLSLGAADLDALQRLGRRVAGELELRSAGANRDAGLRAISESLAASERSAQAPSAELLDAVLSSLELGVLVLRGADHKLLYANAALARFAGIPVEQILALTREGWVAQNSSLFDDPAPFLHQMAVLPEGPFSAVEEFTVDRPTPRVIRWTARPVKLGAASLQLCFYEDVTGQRLLEQQSARLAMTDALTGLPNRRGGEEALAREVDRSRRHHDPLSVCIIDVDGFKAINDGYGHAAGDEALRTVASALRQAARTSDLVVRWGGDEFMALLPDADQAAALRVGERMRESVAAAAAVLPRPVTISVGAVQLAPEEDGLAALARADARLYAAKAAGKNRVT